MYQDKISGLIWSEDQGVAEGGWASAVSGCYNLDFGGHASGWRLPTEKELMEAYAHGVKDIDSAAFSQNLFNSAYWWAATSSSWDSSLAWRVFLGYGAVYGGLTKTDTTVRFLCVR